MQRLPGHVLDKIFLYLDPATQLKFEMTCRDVREAGLQRHHLHLRIDTRPSPSYIRYIRARKHQFSAVSFAYDGPDAQAVATQLGAALAESPHLTFMATAQTTPEATWALPFFLEATCWDRDKMSPLESVFLGRPLVGAPIGFLHHFSGTLKNLHLCLCDEFQTSSFFSLSFPHLEDLCLTGDCNGIISAPRKPLFLPKLKSLALHTLAFTSTPFRTGNSLQDLSLFSAFFVTLEKTTFRHQLTPRRRLTIFWSDFPDPSAVDVARVHTADITLGRDTQGRDRTIPLTTRFPALRSISSCDRSLLDLHPSQVPNAEWPPRS